MVFSYKNILAENTDNAEISLQTSYSLYRLLTTYNLLLKTSLNKIDEVAQRKHR
jgi:Golgi nucleoside diphosphatase